MQNPIVWSHFWIFKYVRTNVCPPNCKMLSLTLQNFKEEFLCIRSKCNILVDISMLSSVYHKNEEKNATRTDYRIKQFGLTIQRRYFKTLSRRINMKLCSKLIDSTHSCYNSCVYVLCRRYFHDELYIKEKKRAICLPQYDFLSPNVRG